MSVNFYDVLNLESTATKKEIKAAYKALVTEFHPDRNSDKDAESVFELIQTAYKVLSDDVKRAEYDKMSKLKETSNHFDMRNSAAAYYKGQDVTEEGRSAAKKSFAQAAAELDQKRGLTSAGAPITTKEATRRLDDLLMAREQQDIENAQERLFREGRFDPSRFNAAFDKLYGGPTDLVPHTGAPLAANLVVGGDYSSVDQFADPFVEGDAALIGGFGSVDFGGLRKHKTLSKEEIDRLEPAKYTKGHKEIDADFDKMLQERLRERDQESDRIKAMKVSEFDTDPTLGGYGVTHEVMFSIDDKSDLDKKYQKLLQMRNAGV